MRPEDRGADYVQYYETLTRERLSTLSRYVTDDMRFKDPFNDVRGVEAYRVLLGKMFDAIPDIRFSVSHRALSGDACFLRWRCRGTLQVAGRKPWVVEGMSELRFADDGRVREHVDHWDAAEQFYEKLPVLGPVLRFIRRRVASH